MSASTLRALMTSVYVAHHLDGFMRDVAGHVPVTGRAPALVLVQPGDDVGERVLAALLELRVDLALHELAGHRIAAAVVPADRLPALVEPFDAALARQVTRRIDLPEARIVTFAANGVSARVVVLHVERASA